MLRIDSACLLRPATDPGDIISAVLAVSMAYPLIMDLGTYAHARIMRAFGLQRFLPMVDGAREGRRHEHTIYIRMDAVSQVAS